jgi:hypothetical protein
VRRQHSSPVFEYTSARHARKTARGRDTPAHPVLGERREEERMATNGKKSNGRPAAKEGRSPLHARWVYAYQLDPPQPEPRFKKINALVRQAQSAAIRKGRLWTGRIVVETLITHLLIVTDHPDQVPAVNRAIETELRQLDMGFALTGPAPLPLSRATRAQRAPRLSPSKSFNHAEPIEKGQTHIARPSRRVARS